MEDPGHQEENEDSSHADDRDESTLHEDDQTVDTQCSSSLEDEDENGGDPPSSPCAAQLPLASSSPTLDRDTMEEIQDFYTSFPTIKPHYRVLSKIGEGTFSSVYKAVDVNQHLYDNASWRRLNEKEVDAIEEQRRRQSVEMRYVALKRIYVTSSPQRIYNEIKILHALSGHPNIVHIVTAMRYEDQVVVVLPYFPHLDFRDYYLQLSMREIRDYMRALLQALEHVHAYHIIHRDIKPSNFLYDTRLRTGVLVDFGLAHKEEPPVKDKENGNTPTPASQALSKYRSSRAPGYLVNDPRPSIRANRAGTRGFRAPEVLLKVQHQTRAIDIWAVGVTLLSIFTGHFPFFHSNDDSESLLEISHIFGLAAMSQLATKLNRRFTTNIPSVGRPIPLEELCEKLFPKRAKEIPPDGFDFLKRLLTLDPKARITAREALKHPFLTWH
ncbi:kinase-like domain-containing protein [Gaertneriomyces semiglobifer]|nr:kinase-like domain-containing protein [Gaertneriomyces semiglobifer]